MQSRSARFYSLDVLRGLAALSVVFWHWQHFFFVGAHPASIFDITRQPFFGLFTVFYRHGELAVDLFFSLSGFIFYWLYSESIARRETSLRDFFVLRFSRLYPLHLLALAVVAVGQFVFIGMSGESFVYPQNDLYHFVLNLFFASSWGLEKGYSFNAPVWSVSVEILLYALFFALSRRLPIRAGVLLSVVAVGIAVLVKQIYWPIGRGLVSFFLGGCVYLVYARIVERAWVSKTLAVLPVLVAALWGVMVLAVYENWDFAARLPAVLAYLVTNSAVLVLFPATILVLALLETRRGTLGRRIAVLGDVSYSSYLLHFPLQLIIAIIASLAGLDRLVFYSRAMLLVFFALLLPLSYLSFCCFERPAQAYLRKRWLLPASAGDKGQSKAK